MGIDFFRKFFDGILIGNVSDHDGCSGVTKDLVFSQKIKATLFKMFVVIGIVIGGIVIVFSYVVIHSWDYIDCAGVTFLKRLVL